MLKGPNICLMGPAGTGKTHSIGSLVDAGIETFYIDLESGLETLIGYWTDRNLPVPANLHWASLPVGSTDLDLLISAAKMVNTMTYKALSSYDDPKKSKHNSFVKLLELMNNFVDERTGESFGPVTSWGPDRAIVIDGLTGISISAMSLTIGGAATAMEGEWGIAMGQVEKFLRMACDGTSAWFILIAHVDREMDPVFGGTRIYVSTLGKKLAPKIPTIFSEVILCNRAGDKWMWDTANSQADLKTRYLGIKPDNPPSFQPIVAKWRNRAAQTNATNASQTEIKPN